MSKPDLMKLIDFNRLVAYDSSQGDCVTVDFPSEQQWKMRFDHIRIELDGALWTDTVAYLKVYCEGAQMQTFFITNGLIKLRGDALPIVFPDDTTRSRVMGLLRGFSGRGPVNFKFNILDSTKKTVELKRLYLVFTILQEDGKIQ